MRQQPGLLVLVLVTAFSWRPLCAQETPIASTTFDSNTYELFEQANYSWDSAELFCEGRSGHLVTIGSTTENEVVATLVLEADFGDLKLGMSDAASEGTWEWVNSEPVTYTNWSSGEPNGGVSANYAMMWRTGLDAGKWSDSAGFESLFVCEIEETTLVAGEEYGGNSYELYERSGISWDSARSFCAQRAAHLVTIGSSGEDAFVHSLMLNADSGDLKLGMSDAADEGTWSWLTEEAIAYTDWASGEPDGGAAENYAMMWRDGADPGKWGSSEGSEPLFVCEQEAITQVGSTIYDESSYTLYQSTGIYWDTARAYCESRSGHLATIGSTPENDALQSLLLMGATGDMWIGMSDAVSEGTWEWVNLEPVTYTNWASGEPGGGPSEDYASMMREAPDTGRWSDAADGEISLFACENELLFGDGFESGDSCRWSFGGGACP